MVAEARTLAPFPDVAVETPRKLTKQEELMRVSEVIQSKPESRNEE